MPDPQEITQLDPSPAISATYLFVGVDTANTSMAPTGTDLKVSGSQVLDYVAANLGPLNLTAVKTANYNAVIGDFIPADATSGNIAIPLPAGAQIGDSVGVILVATTGGHTCTVSTQGSDVFLVAGGSTTTVLSTAGRVQVWSYDGVSVWYPTTN